MKYINKRKNITLISTISLFLFSIFSFFLTENNINLAAKSNSEILQNIINTNNSNTTIQNSWPTDGVTKEVLFTITGNQTINHIDQKIGTKYAILSIPEEVKDSFLIKDSSEVYTNISLETEQLEFLNSTYIQLINLETIISDVNNGVFGSTTFVNFDTTEVKFQINRLRNSLKNFDLTFNDLFEISNDKTYIKLNLEDGINTILKQEIKIILEDLRTSISNLEAKGTNIIGNIVAKSINTALESTKVALVHFIDIALTDIDNNSSDVNKIANISIINDIRVNISASIISPIKQIQDLELNFTGSIIQTDVINIEDIKTNNNYSTIYYNATPTGNITIHYKDELNQDIITSEIIKKFLGENYDVGPKEFDGFTFSHTIGKTTGVITNNSQEITFIYTKNPIEAANITIHYLDTNNNSIAPTSILNGYIDENYSVEEKLISGYNLIQTIGNPTGRFTSESQEIIFIYEEISETNEHIVQDSLPKTGDNQIILIFSFILFIGNLMFITFKLISKYKN